MEGGSLMKSKNSPRRNLVAVNLKDAKMLWGTLVNPVLLSTLEELSTRYGFSLAMGDVMLLDNRWYVSHTGLIRLARRDRCAGIHVRPVPEFSDPSTQRWASVGHRCATGLHKLGARHAVPLKTN